MENTNTIRVKYYINQKDFYIETIICQNSGLVTRKMSDMMYQIANRMSLKWRYNDLNTRHDSVADAYETMFLAIRHFNTDRYDNAFAYFSEVCKRQFTMTYRKNNKLPSGSRLSITGETGRYI